MFTLKNAKLIKGYLFVIASAFIFGCMPLMAKFIYAEGVNSMSLVFLRNTLAIPMLGIIVVAQKGSLKVQPKALLPISAIAIMGCCLTPVLLFTSYNYIASGTATVFHFVYPAVVVLAGFLFLKKKMQIGTLLSVILCVVGIALFYDPNEPINFMGGAFALLSGFTYATYVVLLSIFKHKDISGFRFSFFITVVSALAMLIVCLVSGNLTFPTSITGWLLCLLFAFSLNVGAVVLFQQGTFLIGGERASILSTVEPITSIVAGAVIFHETIGFRTAIGSVLVILASLLIALFDMKTSKAEV